VHLLAVDNRDSCEEKDQKPEEAKGMVATYHGIQCAMVFGMTFW